MPLEGLTHMELLDMVKQYQMLPDKTHSAIPVLFDDIWEVVQ